MLKACDLVRDSVVAINGAPHVVEELRVSTPSARGAASLFRFRFRNLITRAKIDQTCKGDDKFEEIEFGRRAVEFSYREPGGAFVFMDSEDYSQFSLNEDELGDQVNYLAEGVEGIKSLIVNDRPVAIELPQCVELAITECEPTMKGQTVTARTKTARVATGLSVQVPEYITGGERIRVDTRTGAFLGRA